MKAHILLAEDNDTARMLLAKVLAGAGYDVTEAPDGETAVRLLSTQRFDLVLSDIRMRATSGLDVLQAAKQQPDHPAVILMTGYGSLETSIAALRGGVADYLIKPCAPAELLRCIDATLQRRQAERRQQATLHTIAQTLKDLHAIAQQSPSQAPTIAEPPENVDAQRYRQVGYLVLDSFRHTAMCAGQPLHLTPIEYALTQCLVEAEGRVVTYAEIVRQTHGYTVDDAEAQVLIKPHIRNLRRKIQPDPLINVRGLGYRLALPMDQEQTR